MEDASREKLRAILGELLDHMEGAQEIASGLAQERPEEKGRRKEKDRGKAPSFSRRAGSSCNSARHHSGSDDVCVRAAGNDDGAVVRANGNWL